MNFKKMIFFLLPLYLAGCSFFTMQDGYDIRLTGVYYVTYGFAFITPYRESQHIPKADRWTFEILSQTYAKDANHIYYKGNLIPNSDPATLESLGSGPDDWNGYARDAGQVYCWGEILPNAAPVSFEVIDSNLLYARDNKQVYHCADVIAQANPVTFELISGSVSRDDQDYYYYSAVLNVDMESFTLLHNPEGGGTIWGYDKNCYYIHNRCNPIPDPKNFQVISDSFAKDATHVYYLDKVLADADPQSFIVERDEPFFFKVGPG